MKNVTKGWVLRICIYLLIAVAVALFMYFYNNYLNPFASPSLNEGLYPMECIAVTVFCTCLILHRMGNPNNRNQ